jgi:L-glyceraldehyde 3-phosphate reductase
LAQGILTDKYLDSIPKESRAAKGVRSLSPADITGDKLAKVEKLNQLAKTKNRSLSQMAINWVLRHSEVTSALIGASCPSQIAELVEGLAPGDFSAGELSEIDEILGDNID